MRSRPTSVTVICWILIVISVISLISMAVTAGNPMVRDIMSQSPLPIPLQFAIGFIGLGITLASAIFMLKGLAWARMLYLVWGVISTLIGLFTAPAKLAILPGLVVFFVIIFFLFRPAANEYFKGTAAA